MSTKQKRLQAAATAVGVQGKEQQHSPQLGNQSSISYQEEEGGRGEGRRRDGKHREDAEEDRSIASFLFFSSIETPN